MTRDRSFKKYDKFYYFFDGKWEKLTVRNQNLKESPFGVWLTMEDVSLRLNMNGVLVCIS